MIRTSFALLATAAGIVSGCEEQRANAFIGTWANGRERLSIRERGIGTGNVLFISHERNLTWKRADADHLILEFGETAALRSELDAHLQPDGTLLVSFRNSKTVLTKQPPQPDMADR